jgi:predicted phosphodiesterase
VNELLHGVLFVNPGSASLPRPGAGPTAALVEYNPGSGNLTARIAALA